MKMETILQLALNAGAMYAKPVNPKQVKFYEELRKMCDMNSCGNYNTNWGCPPGCGEMPELSERIASFPYGAVYQLVTGLEDSYDFEGMKKGGKDFAKITLAIKEGLEKYGIDFMALGAGRCSLCEKCAYPDKPCRFPNKKNVSVEACGIYVSELCNAAGLNYINGANTLTNTGLIVFSL